MEIIWDGGKLVLFGGGKIVDGSIISIVSKIQTYFRSTMIVVSDVLKGSYSETRILYRLN